ncbi:hypothetical protein P8C59_008560 [Phyllachora maydis]|uniref:Uncharacterized protein n=1 Tax=Phyllachora maydis TaxID=1825666 RepID=A0AAD9IAP4_9PEZI|nr:hypothetical protein P8C59_008560 [Phyllachora maydis]
MPLALAPTLAKPAKITPAIRCIAAYKAKRRDNAGRYTTNSGLTADKDDNNAYNRAYMPPANTEEEEEGGSGDDNSVNSGTSDSTNKGEGGGARERGESASRCEDTPLYKQQRVMSYPYGPSSAPYADIYIYYI